MDSGYSWTELVEMAIQVEKAGESFYRRAAAEMDGEMQSILRSLADAEREHAEVFHSLLPEGLGEGTKGISPEEARPYVKQLVGTGLLGYLAACQDVGKQMGEPMKILEFALGFERETVRFYASIREHATKPGVVDKVISEERKHIERIRKMIESLS